MAKLKIKKPATFAFEGSIRDTRKQSTLERTATEGGKEDIKNLRKKVLRNFSEFGGLSK
jgi:hypothetical protein